MAVKSLRKVRPLKQEADAAVQPPVPPEIADDQLRQRIAEAAYYRAQQRGFSPGYELEDWLAPAGGNRHAPSPRRGRDQERRQRRRLKSVAVRAHLGKVRRARGRCRDDLSSCRVSCGRTRR